MMQESSPLQVERYTEPHLFSVVRLAKAFHDDASFEYDSGFNVDAVIQTVSSADPRNLFLLIIDGVCQGIIYGTRIKSGMTGHWLYQEMIWYVDKGHRGVGLAFLLEVEKLLKEDGVTHIIMAVLENSKTEKLKEFYTKTGYKCMETHFIKEL